MNGLSLRSRTLFHTIHTKDADGESYSPLPAARDCRWRFFPAEITGLSQQPLDTPGGDFLTLDSSVIVERKLLARRGELLFSVFCCPKVNKYCNGRT